MIQYAKFDALPLCSNDSGRKSRVVSGNSSNIELKLQTKRGVTSNKSCRGAPMLGFLEMRSMSKPELAYG